MLVPLIAVSIVVNLPQAAETTVVVENERGARVRNLVAAMPLAAGRNVLEWDGRDDRGEPVPVGSYRWRGVCHGTFGAFWEGAFYSPGSTPWKRNTRPGGWNLKPAGGGGWLSDHNAPYCVFADAKSVYVGCPLAEAGDAIAQVNLDGEKIWGAMWLGLSGAHAFATEGDVLYVASEGGWMGDRFAVNRFDVRNYRWVPNPPEVTKRHVQHDSAFVREDSTNFHGIAGMYLTPEHIVVAFNDRRRLSFFDRKTALWDHDEPLRNAKARALRPSTKILRGLATDADGNVYRCATNANEQCVQVFSPKGTFLRRIGKPGGRRIGKYDPAAMGHPEDVAVDARGRVWVTENSFRPKRTSVWTREGALVREYVGTPFYGGGGSLSPDGTHAYYDGMRFTLPDGKLDAILTDEGKDGNPSTYREFRGGRYLVAEGGYGRRKVKIWEIGGETAKAVAEVPVKGVEWACRVGPNLEILDRSDDGTAILVMTPDAAMAYDRTRAERIALAPELRNFCSLSMTPDGKSFVLNVGGCGNQGSDRNLLCAVARADGRLLWSYPNPYPCNTHNSPIPERGELRHTLGIEGFAETRSGTLMLLNGNKGTRYLFTTDGLFLAELFGDMRTHRSMRSFETAYRGLDLSSCSLEDECFGGWMGNVRGKPHLVEGKDSLNVCRLGGTDTLRRLEGGVLEIREKARRLEDVPRRERGPVKTVRAGGFGLGNDWHPGVEQAFPAKRPVAKFAVGWSDWNLTLRWDVEDATPFENLGDAPHTLFHSGDAVDFRWEGNPAADGRRVKPVEGDQRLVIAPRAGRTTVMRYVYVDPAERSSPVEFVSPAGRTAIARIEEMEEAQVTVVRRRGGYSLTAVIPWKALGETPPFKGGLRRGDAGVVFGDESGTRVVRRAYLFDAEGEVVSDMPTEARVNPSKWGDFRF